MRYFILLILFGLSQSLFSQNALFIPDTISGTLFNLTVHHDSVQFLTGNKTATIGINNYAYLGPTLIINKGDSISLNVQNNLNDTTTMHWHGLHVAPQNDGGPYNMIMPGDSWNPKFTVRNDAATYWYHSHMHGKTGAQALKGQAGALIVRDQHESTLAIPRKYGVDDFPIIVQTQQFDSLNQIIPRGMEDSTMMVNGTQDPYLNVPSQIIRLRLLNADQERTYNFGLTGNQSFNLIALDGGLINNAASLTRIRLSPGERAEILVNFSGMNGQTIYLMSYASELPMDIMGGPTMPMPPGNPPMDSPLNGIDFNILQFNVVAQTSNPVLTFPTVLNNITPLLSTQAQKTRNITFTSISMMSMDGPFFFNGLSYDMMRIDYEIPINNIEIWNLTNQTMVAHPFHIHDVFFNILDRDGISPDVSEQGKKDVVLIQANETVRIIMQFNDFSNDTIPYVYHCHNLMHEDDGMMGQFIVKPANTGIAETYKNNGYLSVFPNPSSGLFELNSLNELEQITIRSIEGKIVYCKKHNGKTAKINIEELDAGTYFVTSSTVNNTYSKIIIIK